MDADKVGVLIKHMQANCPKWGETVHFQGKYRLYAPDDKIASLHKPSCDLYEDSHRPSRERQFLPLRCLEECQLLKESFPQYIDAQTEEPIDEKEVIKWS